VRLDVWNREMKVSCFLNIRPGEANTTKPTVGTLERNAVEFVETHWLLPRTEIVDFSIEGVAAAPSAHLSNSHARRTETN